ncbi:MAG: hypothetical protein C0608_09600 [Deltaproteobacteria bacterium]|nr:MAG: hypothetical protein C0608_09600 [Deltaproteobacteria bacterium]
MNLCGATLDQLLNIATEILAELWEIFPYFIVGVAIEAWVRTKKWHLKIRKALTRYGLLAIGIATVLGIVSPLCACGILPLTISLILSGLPLAPAMSLLVASPLMSPAGYSLALKNVGPALANSEVAGALFLGVFAGVVVHIMERRGFDVLNLFRRELPKGDFHDPDYPDEVLRCFCNEMFSKRVERDGGGPVSIYLAKMWEGGVKVGKYLILGVAVQVLALHVIPDAWIDALLTSGNPLAVIGLTLAVVPLHITQITATAMLFGFMDKGVDSSTALALLIGGPVTALPAISVFITLFRPKVFLLYLSICISGTLLVSFLFPLAGF